MSFRRGNRALAVTFALVAFFVFPSCTEVKVVHRHSLQGIVLLGLPGDSRVYVDSKYVGPGDKLNGVRLYLKPGKHHVMVTASGRYPFFWALTLRRSRLITRRVVLPRVTDG